MKFKVNGTEFNEVLSKVIKGFNNKEDNSYVAFELNPEDGNLDVSSRSRSTYFKGQLDVSEVEMDPGEANVYHLDGVKLKQLISILPKDPVDIEFQISDKTRSFIIKTATSKYKLPVLSETILAPTPNITEYVTVDANDFMDVAKDLIKIVSTDASTQEHQISCMHLNIKDENLKMTATDSYALGTIKIDSSKNELEEEKDLLIRHTEVNTLLDTFVQGEMLTVVGSDDMFGYIDENGTLALVRVIDMDPLNTEQIEAFTKKDNTVLLDRNELKNAIETVAKLSPNDETVDIDLSMENTARVSNRYGDYIDVTVAESKLDSPGTASFSTSVIIKSINPANTGPIRLEFGDLSVETHGAARVVSLQADGSDDTSTSLIATRLNN